MSSMSRRHTNLRRRTGANLKAPRYKWTKLPDEELLDWRIRDLELRIEGTWLIERVGQLYEELERKNLLFRPHVWLSDEWFTPDGVPGIAIPFYLAHPRLIHLERRQMFEAEGSTRDWCMRILRHEAGHALDNAFRLHRRRRWREVFGRISEPYPEFYQPRPYSKRFVLHLDSWYAQSHPAEDFAETFAVWLRPKSGWRRAYRGWPALKKLEYVDTLMGEIAGQKPPVRSRATQDSSSQLKKTLREYYVEKRTRYGEEHPDFYDRDLRRLFVDRQQTASRRLASAFLRRIREEIRRKVSYWTGEYQYTIDQVLQEMIERCEELELRVERPEEELKQEAMILLTVQTMNYLHGGYHRVAL